MSAEYNPYDLPDDRTLAAFGAFVVGTLDGYLKDGASPQQVVENLFLGAAITGIILPLPGD